MVAGLKRPLRVAFGLFFARSTRAARDFCATLAIAAIVLLPVSISSSAELSRPAEYEVKAAFLYNFVKFTEWPPEQLGKDDDPFVIGVLGKDPFGTALDKVIQGETIHRKTIVARRFARMDEAAASSHVLFIGASEENHLTGVLRVLAGQSVLTVSEIENFAHRGGVIHLKKENNRIVFEINLEAARRAKLNMDAQLLRLAKIVRNAP